LALTFPTSGGRSVGIVRPRSKATAFSLVLDVTPCNLVEATDFSDETIPSSGPNVRQTRNQQEAGGKLKMFRRKIGGLLQDYTVLPPRIQSLNQGFNEDRQV
jgi:hypothetical protein